MGVFGASSNALFFNGVNDSVICPQGGFTQTGHKVGDSARTSSHVLQDGDNHRQMKSSMQSLGKFSIEAWVSPDSGGVIASKDGVFELRMGSVGAPAPAIFTIHTQTGVSFSVKSANNYPTNAGTFVSNNVGLNTEQRELYHIIGAFSESELTLYINGELVAYEKLNTKYSVPINTQDLYLGGKGGEYRGYIESVHWKRGVPSVDLRALPVTKETGTIGMWRFEEPVEVDSDIFHIKSNLSANATTITLDATQVQTLYRLISGKSDTFTGTYTPESLGNYRAMNSAHPSGKQVVSIPHRAWNMLINPTGTDIMSKLPNNKPPERVRLVSLSDAGTIVVNSIHLDFNIDDTYGARGVLHARTAYNSTTQLANDSTMVLIRSDLLVDSQTGKPHQMAGMASQAIDRTGAMIIDESGNDFHGFLYSRQCSINESGNPFTVSSANWAVDDKLQTGHNGRHFYNYGEGHPFLRILPPSTDHTITRTIDGLADSIRVHYPAANLGIKDQLPINSKITLTHTALHGAIHSVITSATVTNVVRNGMAPSIDSTQDGVIGIGVDNIKPFLLKGHGFDDVVTGSNAHTLHAMPEDVSRVAIMQVSTITSCPYVEIHYKAIDLTGAKMGIGNPCLLVEKTVPSANTVLDGHTIAHHIANVSNAVIHAPGGVVVFTGDVVGDASTVMIPHRLVGDNTGGTEREFSLNESRIPANYTPALATDLPNSIPIGVEGSNESSLHPSVYNRLILHPLSKPKGNSPTGGTTVSYQVTEQNASQQGAAFEVFDIIDNYIDSGYHYVIVQPSRKNRTMQLSRVVGTKDDSVDHTFATIEYIQGQGRINSFKVADDKGSRQLIMRARGLMDDVSDQSVTFTGDGSPDSHIVKEIQPGAPVVSVTLGGAGQGAINTKPSWDPSPLSRVGWNTRRDCTVEVTAVDTTTGTITVQPLNNNSANLASWGTYCFPPTGRVHMINGANAEYKSRTGTAFTFDTATGLFSSGSFVASNGNEHDSFAAFVSANNVVIGTQLILDPLFNTQSVCEDGTTVNDRLFQSLGTISHDYQLGTQYASTRALAEIPLFPNQFFENREQNIFPGPDNSMKIHLDATMTAHTWCPSPVGRRSINAPAIDKTVFGPYYKRWYNDETTRAIAGTMGSLDANRTWVYLNIEEGIERIPDSNQSAGGNVRNGGSNYENWIRKIILDNGEWCYYHMSNIAPDEDRTNKRIKLITTEGNHSADFFVSIRNGSVLTVGQQPFKIFKPLSNDTTHNTLTSAQEYRRPFYYDRANTQTQGGNVDYGLRQYVSAVEFKAGPLSNPHLARIESGCAKITVLAKSGSGPFDVTFKGELPKGELPANYHYAAINEITGDTAQITYDSSANVDQVVITTAGTNVGDVWTITSIESTVVAPYKLPDGTVNSKWNHPYAPGGLRYGDTVWMNMHYTNPHAIEGLFAKSRGVLNEYEVWSEFNGGKGDLTTEARTSLPLENFLIGNTCMETAKNFVQHVNKTISLNWTELGHGNNPPIVAYLDPYLSTEQHARVLLYDVAHDREFIAFHDLHMQVQTSARTPFIDGLDVAAGFATQAKNKTTNSTHHTQSINSVNYTLHAEEGKSTYTEGAYAHASWYLMDADYATSTLGQFSRPSRQTRHIVKTADITSTEHDRVEPSSVSVSAANTRHAENMLKTDSAKVRAGSADAYDFNSTFFDTPDGTRVIPAFLCMKGKRSSNLSLTAHYETALQSLPHWYSMDFARRLSIDFGEVGIKDGVTDIEAAAKEVVRLINQAGAINGRSSQRRPSDQYSAEGERFDINRRAVTASGQDTNEPSDPTSAHHHADFATTGSTHDPSPFWDDSAFTSYNRGSHMGYMRAHIGRVVEDIDGNEGFSVVIHSTVPGASGRNFCVWLDNSKGQSEYRPQYLVGHGGRFRNYYCASPDIAGENMHPAPMPIDKNGKPFAPITTLREYVSLDEELGDVTNSQNLGYDVEYNTNTVVSSNEGVQEGTPNTEATTGRNSNSINMESFEDGNAKMTVREGLQTGTRAVGRINFGGLVASGVPGFAPDAGIWGFGANGHSTSRFQNIYGKHVPTGNASYSSYGGYVPASQVNDDNIGNEPIYGFKITDHRGKSHIIRMVYRTCGESFTHKNTKLPPTIDEEIVIYIDDRDVTQGGFTLGNRMWGVGGSGTEITSQVPSTAASALAWRGNKFRGVRTHNSGFAVSIGDKTTQFTSRINSSGQLTINVAGSGVSAGTYTLFNISGANKGSGASITVTVSGGAVNGITGVPAVGSGYAVGDVLGLTGTNARVTVSALFGSLDGYAYPSSIYLKTGSGVGNQNTGIWHNLPEGSNLDALGWLGFPDSGLIWVAVPHTASSYAGASGKVGRVFHYSGRTHNAYNGEHGFFGLTGIDATSLDVLFDGTIRKGPTSSSNPIPPVIISPHLNQTTIVTDELLAAAVAHAFTIDPNDEDGVAFDCSELYAPDGRTYGDWLGDNAQTAIRIKAFNSKKNLKPLSDLFNVNLFRDYGIQASSSETAPVASIIGSNPQAHMGGLTQAERNAGVMFDAGYLPKTVLQINTNYFGHNANTATPVLIDSNNNPVDTSEWKKHLRGEKYTRFVGDHITPAIDNLPFGIAPPLSGGLVHAVPNSGYVGYRYANDVQHPTTWISAGSATGAEIVAASEIRTGGFLSGNFGSIRSDKDDNQDIPKRGHSYTIAGEFTVNNWTFAVTSAGTSGYAASTTYTLTGGGGSGAKIQVGVNGSGQITSIEGTVAFGTGYANSDVLTVAGGSGDATVTVSKTNQARLITKEITSYRRTFSDDGTPIPRQRIRCNNGWVSQTYRAGPLGREHAWVGRYGAVSSDAYTISTAATDTFGGAADLSWVEPKRLYYADESILVYPVDGCFLMKTEDGSENWTEPLTGKYPNGIQSNYIVIYAQEYKTEHQAQFSGLRLAGNTNGEPLTYFRGAQDSVDHSVPLYFGGGFSGVTMDVNDGAKVDYTSHNEHPYASGPTGCAGMQDIGEKMGSYALLDSAAMFAMFPGSPLCDQMHGTTVPPFANQDAILATDMDGNNDAHDGATGKTYTNVKIVKPSPIILRFAHPYARYTDSDNSVAYVIFGPGQAAPKHWKGELQSMSTSREPTGKWVVAAKEYAVLNGSTVVGGLFSAHTDTGHLLPNELHNGTLDSAANQLLPPTDAYGANNVYPGNAFRHWETPLGFSNSHYNQTSAAQSRNVSNHFGSPSSVNSAGPKMAHPFSHYKAQLRFTGKGITAAPEKTNLMIFHLDGGYSPGGSWFDDTIRKNPAHPITGATVASRQTATWNSVSLVTGLDATMFRVGAAVATGFDTNADTTPPLDTFVIDATRCQNSEELAAIVAAAINTWPGPANLKAIGGSFLPSFQDAQRQDRYSWVEMNQAINDYDDTNGLVTLASNMPSTLPANGWVRVSNGTNAFYGYYSHRSDDTFILGNNYRSNTNKLENPTVATGASSVVAAMNTAALSGYKAYVWSKSGNLRWDNGFQEAALSTRSDASTSVMVEGALTHHRTNSIFDHLAATQVHFNGVTDAIDRTRAVGAVGWHGERYSYLNSLNIGTKVAAGLGAWLPASGFNPYGPSQSCHTVNSIQMTIVPADGGIENALYQLVPTVSAHPATSRVHQRHYIAISYEGDLPIIAKASRNGQPTCGDMLALKWSASNMGGTVVAYHNERFNNDRYNAESNAGPHVEALYESTSIIPKEGATLAQTNQSTQATLFQMDACLFPTGDLFYDADHNPGLKNYSDSDVSEPLFDGNKLVNQNVGYSSYSDHLAGVLNYGVGRSAARNFFVEHVVWKRMSGGNLSLPAPNARGLGSIPWQYHKVGGAYVKFGETIYGNTRFSFETTNKVMFPIVQAQELAHPSLAQQYPYEIRNALSIPNEELQFNRMEVTDDTGQVHTLAGGSPLGVVIRDYELKSDRESSGLSPALANSGIAPNMKIQLPNHDEIPSNILVRSGFDRLQAYQHETMGDGGLQHPSQPSAGVESAFGLDGKEVYTAPYWEQNGYERISNNPNTFPDSQYGLNEDNVLKTAYEPHDRALYFHITKMGYTYTEREPLGIVANVMTHNPLTVKAIGTNYITVNETITESIWQQNATRDGRCFIVINGTIASFAGTANDAPLGERFTQVVFAPDFTAIADDVIKPSYYIPAGTTRHYAARRLRDHAEVSGNSPDKPLTNWAGVANNASPATAVRAANKLTPMPLPRMGHHYVTPTMATMPGHLAHPVYRQITAKNNICDGSTKSAESIAGYDNVEQHADTLVWFSGATAPTPPSDIHGDGFTLLTETKIRFDGYGIADDTAACNAAGGHRIKLEKGTNYNTSWNFPDPMEVGAYQIVIQPNLFSQQVMGNNANTVFSSTSAPVNAAGAAQTTKPLLTDQTIATVIALQFTASHGYDLILSEATMADVRGCEIYLNELMLDVDPSTREQFTNIPLLGLQNPFGINASSSGAFTRRSLPYHPNMFRRATPGPTITVPWWSVAYDQSTVFAGNKWMQTSYYHPDDYYLFCRATLGGVGCQLTMTGYPTHYLDVYTEYLASLTPTCTIKRLDATGGAGAYKIFVDNNSLFPLVGTDYKNHKLAIEGSDGVTYYITYTNRGYASDPDAGENTTVFVGVTASAYIWGKLAAGQTVRLTGPSATLLEGEVYSDSDASVATRNLPQLLTGTRDTNSAHTADAYLCLWHYNLGRPMTWFSDSRASATAVAIDHAPYNHLPEHFETVHYQDFVYAMSDGPFKFRMRGWDGPGDGLVDAWTDTGNYPHQAGLDGKSRQYHYGSFWPGGHRFGAQMSDLTLYGTASIGWGAKDGKIQIDTGTSGLANKGLQIAETVPSTLTDVIGVDTKRRVGMGYRVSVRQPYNRPKWAIKGGQGLRDPYASHHFNLDGPFVSQEAGTGKKFTESNSASANPSAPYTASYTGILERHTNASALIGSDLIGQQVRYSHGRRMTKSFGCAVRNIINPTTGFRLFHGDTPAGLEGTDVVNQRVSLALAQAHYMVDWWGNTTGEEVRRFPVRGFGIRPSWDPEDSYSANDRTVSAEAMVAQRSNIGAALAVNDFFNPATAKRVGDRGDGRGVRWPTVFNEDILQAVSTPVRPVGMVLSHHTSEPPFTSGYIRASNDTLQNYEVPRGISSRLEISNEDGLLDPSAMMGSNTATTDASFLPASESIQEPISRVAPRIGLDAPIIGTTDKKYGIIGTEALSLHTDRAVGQRFILAGGVKTTDRTLGDYDLTAMNMSSNKQVMRFGQTHGVPVIGGSYILEVSSYIDPISDLGWGRSNDDATHRSSNPYQTTANNPLASPTNVTDKTMKFLVRPVRVLDHKHIEIFRTDKAHFLSATAAGRYGVFSYDMPNARATVGTSTYVRSTNPAPTNAPYAPVYLFDEGSSTAEPVSFGPKLPGFESPSFSLSLKQPVARMIVSSNTLQHYRGDASRKQSVKDADDVFFSTNYTIQPRFTQLLYPGDKQNTTNHASESNRADNELD